MCASCLADCQKFLFHCVGRRQIFFLLTVFLLFHLFYFLFLPLTSSCLPFPFLLWGAPSSPFNFSIFPPLSLRSPPPTLLK